MIGDLENRLVTNHHTRSMALMARRVSASSRMLPSFVIVGAQKAGTTSLHAYLGRHDSVLPAALKETRHFDLTPQRGAHAYRSFFPRESRDSGKITGEATPDYLLFPWVPSALAAVVPEVRVIIILRDPVERAFSHYRHTLSRGEEHLSFDAALDAEAGRLAGGPQAPGSAAAIRFSRFSYATRGRYAEQIRRWFAVFPREHVLLLSFRDLAERPQDTVDQTTGFLGLAPFTLGDASRHNVGEAATMSPEARERLRDHFAPHDRELTDLIGEAPYWVDQTS